MCRWNQIYDSVVKVQLQYIDRLGFSTYDLSSNIVSYFECINGYGFHNEQIYECGTTVSILTYLHHSFSSVTQLPLYSYDFRMKMMFGSSLHLVVCMMAHVLIYAICVYLRIVVSHT